TAAAFSLQCPNGSARAFTRSPAPATPGTQFTLTPSAPLPDGTTCVVKVTASEVTDSDVTDPPDTMASDFSFSFTTTNPADTAPSVTSVTPANTTNVPVNSPL